MHEVERNWGKSKMNETAGTMNFPDCNPDWHDSTNSCGYVTAEKQEYLPWSGLSECALGKTAGARAWLVGTSQLQGHPDRGEQGSQCWQVHVWLTQGPSEQTHKCKMDAWGPTPAIRTHLAWVGPWASVFSKATHIILLCSQVWENTGAGGSETGEASSSASPHQPQSIVAGSQAFDLRGHPGLGLDPGSAICCVTFAKWADFSKFQFLPSVKRGWQKWGWPQQAVGKMTCINRCKGVKPGVLALGPKQHPHLQWFRRVGCPTGPRLTWGRSAAPPHCLGPVPSTPLYSLSSRRRHKTLLIPQ